MFWLWLLNIASKIAAFAQGGHDSKDRQLMLDKIAFMAGVAEHENIVKFIASCNHEHEGFQSIQIMLTFSYVILAICTH